MWYYMAPGARAHCGADLQNPGRSHTCETLGAGSGPDSLESCFGLGRRAALHCHCGRRADGSPIYEDGKLRALLEQVDGSPDGEVTECGPCCSCEAACTNRLTQQGLARRIYLDHSKSKGWAARASDAIPKGSFVCQVQAWSAVSQYIRLRSQRCCILFTCGGV